MIRLLFILIVLAVGVAVVGLIGMSLRDALAKRRPGPLLSSSATVLGCRCDVPPGMTTPVLQQAVDPQAISLRYVSGASSPTYYASFGLPTGQVLDIPVDAATVQLLSASWGMTGQLTWQDGRFVGFQPQDLR